MRGLKRHLLHCVLSFCNIEIADLMKIKQICAFGSFLGNMFANIFDIIMYVLNTW